MTEPIIGLCPGCGQEKVLKAKGVCNNCYVQFRRTGSYSRERQPRGMCTVEGCTKEAHGKGLCHMHARRLRVSGDLNDPRLDNVNLRTNKRLYAQWSSYQRADAYPIAAEWKEDFFVFLAGVGERPSIAHRLYRIDKTKPLGPGNFEWRERLVTRHADETDVEYNARHRSARRTQNGSAMWDSDLRAKYGADFGLRDLRAMAESQGHLCAICGKPETMHRNGRPQHLTVDHDHITGAIRALLCSACNTGLGLFRDDPVLMAQAIAYLAKHAHKKVA